MRVANLKVLTFLGLLNGVHAALSCDSLTGQWFSNGTATVTFATSLFAGSNFTGDSTETSYNTQQTNLPSLCRVVLNVQTGSNSSAMTEVWLPSPSEWNSRVLAVGNGGFAGGVNYPDIVWGLRKGFATMSTNAGHNSTSGDGSWLGNAEQAIDWGHRAMHYSVVAAKQVVTAYYSTPFTYSYYAGCSTGGRQGLAAAERYPDDFNGVLSGSAIAWQTHTSAWQTYVALLQYPSTRTSFIPAAMWAQIAAAVLEQCDEIDGVADNVIMDPSKCVFRPEVLLCGKSTANATACLNKDQVLNLKRMYLPWLTGESDLVNPGISPGGEASFSALMNSAEPLFGPIFYRNAIYNSSTWDWTGMSIKDVDFADTINPGGSNAYDPDLRPFEAGGGKIMQYHGYADPLIPAMNAPAWYDSINYFYNSVGKAGDVEKFYRLFMVPGMGHCSGGVGPWVLDGASQGGITPATNSTSHSMLYSLVNWVESPSPSISEATGVNRCRGDNSTYSVPGAPESVIGSKYINNTPALGLQFTRPICRWPVSAIYDGVGDVNNAASWKCPTAGVY